MRRDEWELLAAAHRDRLLPSVEPHVQRRRRDERHPVEDFLFSYYRHSPGQLLQWHPGYGVVLEDASEYIDRRGYHVVDNTAYDFRPGPSSSPRALQRQHPGFGTALAGTEELLGFKGYAETGSAVGVTLEHLRSQEPLLRSFAEVLGATAARAPVLGCFGLHEWAMVYRLSPEQVRHAAWPLRLGGRGTDEVVEGHRVSCSHFDAYRFFTDAARPLNTLRPGRDDRAAFEQPGCLHAGMDLYRFAFRLSPLVSSTLVADCFELARDIRVLDMRASPYDLSGLGYEPVRIETTEGKQEYVEAQRGFAVRGAPLRARLLADVARLLAVLDADMTGDAAGAIESAHDRRAVGRR